jgi:hypothetical protein
MLISIERAGKNQLESGQISMGDAPVLSIVLCYEILYQNRPVCLSISVKEKPTVGYPLFGAFPSDRIPKATKDVSVHFFIHSSNSCKFYQRILGTFLICCLCFTTPEEICYCI